MIIDIIITSHPRAIYNAHAYKCIMGPYLYNYISNAI